MRIAALILALLALARPASAVTFEMASPEQKRAAQKTFEAADELFRKGSFEEALTAFRASYELVGSANTRLMIARCLHSLDRLLDARAEFVGTISDAEAAGDRYAQALEAARTELGALNDRLGFVTITASGASSVLLNDRELGPEELGVALPLLPAPTVIEARWSGGRAERKELELRAGSYEIVELQEPPAPPPPPAAKPVAAPSRPPRDSSPGPARPLAYVAGGVGLAGLATFTVFGLLNNSTYASLQDACSAGSCPPDRAEDIDSGRTYQTLANVGLAVGIVGLGAGATLFVLSSGSSSESVSARVGASSVSVAGSF